MPGYILSASPRSGSTLLCDLLWQTRVAGKPNSFFRPQSVGNFCRSWGLPETTLATVDQAYLDAAIAEGVQGTGTFGLRIMHDNIAGLLARLKALNDQKDDVAALTHVFGPLRFIHLSRDDKVAQAVSLAMAEQTGLWHKNADGTDRENFHRSPDPIYDRDQIARELAGLEKEARGWATWFATNGITPLRLTYETLSLSLIHI